MEIENDPWSKTGKIKCKRCGMYNPVVDSICHHAENGDVDQFAYLYVCQVCGHRGAQVTRLVAKRNDNGEATTPDNLQGAYYRTDIS
jgi:DNA-directed RNA polymerase subunit RPC12/RpoP